VYFAAFQKCRCTALFIPSMQAEPARASLKYVACRYRVSNTFRAPCMKTVSVNNCLDYGACRVFVNYYLYSTVCKMLPDSLLQSSLNVRLDDLVNPPTVQEEVPLPKIVICNLIVFIFFITIKMRFFFLGTKWLEQLSPV
jgi:hypothetical protein